MNLVFKYKYQQSMKGVYIYRIGEMFYIGRSINIGLRAKQHASKIKSTLNIYSKIINNLCTYTQSKTSKSYIRAAIYLLEHPRIKNIIVEVIHCCSLTNDMCIKEKQLLRLYENHPCCLNSIFESSIIYDNHIIKYKKVGRFLYYYEERNPNELMPSIPYKRRNK